MQRQVNVKLLNNILYATFNKICKYVDCLKGFGADI